jgi:hypothetical protein
MFALTHHLVVQYCYYRAYKVLARFDKYSLLGDDIVIWDESVAIEYQLFMNEIGVEINFSKSFVGLTNSGEFAKRHFLRGQNISGFGYPLVKQSFESFNGWIRFLEILEQEGFLSTGAVLLLPGHGVLELSKSSLTQLA